MPSVSQANKGRSMSPSGIIQARAQRAAKILSKLFTDPPPPLIGGDDVEEERYQAVDDLGEPAAQDSTSLQYPRHGSLSDSLAALQNVRVWAIDGGVLTQQLPYALILAGRAVVVKMVFSGHTTVEKFMEFPAFPYLLHSTTDETQAAFEESLAQLLNLWPEKMPTLWSGPAFFSSAQELFDAIPPQFHALGVESRRRLQRAIDSVRNAAELLAFLYAQPGDLVLRDGRIWGNFGFLTGLISYGGTQGQRVVDEFIQALQGAINRDVRIVGIIKSPEASYCLSKLREYDVKAALKVPSDTVFYHRTLDAGTRSSLWRITGEKRSDAIAWFWENYGCFFLKVFPSILPFRVDFLTYNNMFQRWFVDEILPTQLYVLALGGGSPSGLPHPILIADHYAKIHRPDLVRELLEIIRVLENGDEEQRQLAEEMRAFITYREGG